MFLPIFDHPQSPQSLEMQSAILQVNQAHLLFLFTPDESQYVRERKKALLGYRESLVRDQLGAHNFFSSHKEYEKSVIQKSNLYYWREEQQKFLENEAVWQRLIQFSSHKPKLYAMRIKWQAHAALSRWNHQAILHVALNLLPKLMEYHQKELARCENLSLPQTTLDAYQSYLKKFLQQAEGLQKLIAESMFARLRALMIDGFKHADVTKEIIVQLQALGSVSPNMPVPSRFEEITPKQFVAFHGYLLQQKSVPLQEKMHTLGWLIDPTQLVSIVQPQAFRTLVVPTDLASDVPTGKRWPGWLFKGHNFRWKFFKDKGILLALLTALSSEKAGTQIQDI
jgi:hypothetical protein